MHCRDMDNPSVFSRLPRWVHLLACVVLLAGVAACGSRPAHQARTNYNPSRYYPPPGSHEDPWGPYIHEASGRYGVPELWIRRVMRQESGGQEDVISWAGAMGLMQVMPDTYDDLKSRYTLGDDPFDPRNNILAGTAYLREMYDRFGAPGFLAAYNAGPNRLDRYLNNGTPLPAETINYVASIAPSLGSGTPMSGPLAVYGGSGTRLAAREIHNGCDPDAAFNPDGPCTAPPASMQPVVVATSRSTSGDCDPDAAYDPTGPCIKLRPVPVQSVTVASALPYAAADCDPDSAYDPSRPCRPLPAVASHVIAEALLPPSRPQPAAHASYEPAAHASYEPAAHATYEPAAHASYTRPIQELTGRPNGLVPGFVPGPPAGRWAVQVGAFANLGSAQTAAETARRAAPELLRLAKIELPPTTPFGTQVAFRARLSGLSASAAADVCARLSHRGQACMTVAPDRGSF